METKEHFLSTFSKLSFPKQLSSTTYNLFKAVSFLDMKSLQGLSLSPNGEPRWRYRIRVPYTMLVNTTFYTLFPPLRTQTDGFARYTEILQAMSAIELLALENFTSSQF